MTLEWRLPTPDGPETTRVAQATVVVAAAERPAATGDWADADSWLPETFGAVTPEEVLTESEGSDGLDPGAPWLSDPVGRP